MFFAEQFDRWREEDSDCWDSLSNAGLKSIGYDYEAAAMSWAWGEFRIYPLSNIAFDKFSRTELRKVANDSLATSGKEDCNTRGISS